MTALPILIREYRETDKAFIVDSWVNSMAYSCPALFWVPRSLIHSKYRAMISSLVDARPELFRVLVNEANEDQIFAWACAERLIRHFEYTKEDFRGQGLAHALHMHNYQGDLYQDSTIAVTNWTSHCEQTSRYIGVEYKPSLFKELINGINQTVGITLPKPMSFMGKTFERTILASDRSVVSLDYNESNQTVRLEVESKAEMPTIVLIPFSQCSGIIPEPSQDQLESVPIPRVAPPEPVYVPPPEPLPPPEPKVVTAEEAEAIRKAFHAKHKGPQPQQWEIDAAAEAEHRAKRHMGVSEPTPEEPPETPSRPENDAEAPKPKRKKAKRKAKRKSK